MTTHIGLIGSGNITQTHARAASAIPHVKISAVYGTNPQNVTRLATEHQATPYNNFEAFLSHKPLDAVILGTPSGLHAQQGIAAAEHGLHVLTEKSISASQLTTTSL